MISASVAIEVSPADSYDDSYTEMKKHMVVQLPVEGILFIRIQKQSVDGVFGRLKDGECFTSKTIPKI